MEPSTDLLSAAAWLSDLRQYEAIARIAGATFFGVALLLSGMQLQNPEVRQLSQVSRLFFILGMLAAVSQLTFSWAIPQSNPESLVTLGLTCLLSLAVLTIDFDRDRLPAFTFLSGALCWSLLVVTPFLFPTQPSPTEPLKELSPLGTFHVASAVIGEGIFVLGFLTSLVYLYVHGRLRRRMIDKKPLLPSLEALDTMVRRSTLLGMLLITASLITGLGMLFQGYSLESVGIVKILWAFGVWIWYVLAIFGRAHWGWRGRKGAVASVIGASLMALALFGTFWS